MNHEDRLQGLDDSDRALVQTLQDWNRVADSPGKPVAAGPWARHVIQQAAHQRRTRGTIASGATALMSGILAGYIVYDLSHYYTHHARPRAKYGKYLKAWHLAHHHKWWTRMYGVSSPFWDLVFRTGKP